ncbi:MAG: hypothetical protein GXO42_03165 [bacterium]|nr:hypothetical protein [bacterium]
MKIRIRKSTLVRELVYTALLVVFLAVNLYILAQPANVNKIVTASGKVIPVLTNVDGFLWLRILEHIYKYGSPIVHDNLRAWPKGLVYRSIVPFISFNIEYLTLPLAWLFHSPWYAAIYMPCVYAIITAALIYFYVRRTTKKALAGLVAAAMFIFTAIGLFRFSAGFYDHDILCCMYLIICLWLTYELLLNTRIEKSWKSILRTIILAGLFLLWYSCFCESSATWRAYPIILGCALVLLELARIRIPLKNLAVLLVVFFIAPLLTSRFMFHEGYKVYVKTAANLFFYACLAVYLLAEYVIRPLYEKKLQRLLKLEFSEAYFLFLLVLVGIAWWALFNVPALKSKFIVLKQVGITRTIAEYQPLINWNLFFKDPLAAIGQALNNLAAYYSCTGDPWHLYFWTAFAEIIIFTILYIIHCIYRKLKLFEQPGMVYFFSATLAYFVLAILAGSQGVRLLSLFPPAIACAFCLGYTVIDEQLLVRFFKEQAEKLSTKEYLHVGIYLALLAYFAGIYIYYAQLAYKFLSTTWLAALNEPWYLAMEWIAHNTPKNAAFDFWWDYGYWVQALGHRPTLTDGGHAAAVPYFDYKNAYYVFLGNLSTSIAFLKKFRASYLLISWEEIGKWGAISYNAQYYANTFLHKHVHYWSYIVPCVLAGKQNSSYVFVCPAGATPIEITVQGNLSSPSKVELSLPGRAPLPIQYYGTSASAGLEPRMFRVGKAGALPVIFVVSGAFVTDNPRLAALVGSGELYLVNYLGGYLIISAYSLNDPLFDAAKVAHSTFVQLFLLGKKDKHFICVYSCDKYAIPIVYGSLIRGFYPVVKIWYLQY